jgi:hypothetical protein
MTPEQILSTIAEHNLSIRRMPDVVYSSYSMAHHKEGNEIKKWLLDNNRYNYDSYRVTDHSYVIIDDDGDMLYQQRHNFFQVSPSTGLTREIADKIIQFLK